MPSSDTKVITGTVRLSYVHLFEPYAVNPEQQAKYSCTLLIKKSDKATLSAIRKAQQVAAEQGAARVFGGKVPKNVKTTLHDGDEEADLERNPEMEGCYYMAVQSSTKPGVVDKDVEPILDSTEVYSGCYARVSMNAFAYSNSGNKGVSFGLNHVQKVADGDFLGGRSRATDDFEALDDEGDEDAESFI